MDNNIAAIGKRIKKYRKKAGLTQQNVAESMNWSTNFVSRIERGCTMTSVYNLCELANVLGTTVDTFFIDVVPAEPADLINTPRIQELMRQITKLDKQHQEYILESLELYISTFKKS